MEPISGSITINAPQDSVLAVALDAENYPSWQKEVQKVEVLERTDDGRPNLIQVHFSSMGMAGKYQLRFVYPAAGCFEYHLADKGMMTKHDATWRIESKGSDTEVTFSLSMDIKLPMPAFMIKQMTEKGVRDMLNGLAARMED